MMHEEVKAQIFAACESAKKHGLNLVIAVLDDKTEGLAVLSSYDSMSQQRTMETLRAITEVYLCDEEAHDQKRSSIIH